MAKVSIEDKDLGWKNIVKALNETAEDPNSVAYVGYFADDEPRTEEQTRIQHQLEGTQYQQVSNAELAVIHEFGTDKIPERSFMRSTFDAKRDTYEALVEKMAPQVIDGKMKLKRLLSLVGMKMTADIKHAVKSGAGIPPPLQPETVKRKGSSRALVDTAQMINALTWDVGPERGE